MKRVRIHYARAQPTGDPISIVFVRARAALAVAAMMIGTAVVVSTSAYASPGNAIGSEGPQTAPASAVDVGAGIAHSLALRVTGRVWAWGYNGRGELGDGTGKRSRVPVRVSGLTGVVAISAGSYHTLAVRADGTVWAWGSNTWGQIGDDTTTDRFAPVQVPGLTNIVAVDAGFAHSLAVRADGTVWAWGQNFRGELGDGTTTDRHSPVQVTGLTDPMPSSRVSS